MPLALADAIERRPLRPADFGDWASYYFAYQHVLTQEYLLPLLKEWGCWREGVRVLDVGCGDGGASVALAEAGARVAGFDLDAGRAEAAQERARSRGVELRLAAADITRAETLEEFAGPFDLVLFRDVLEHIPEARVALEQARERLTTEGRIVIVFPPYYSPYGGHQQILHPPRRLGLRWAKLPYAHWLPRELFSRLANGPGEIDAQWEEILTIRRARLSLAGMQRLARAAGLVRERSRRFLLRPTFRLRYGTRVLGAGGLDRIPGLREVLITGSYESFRALP
jgi:SAM-dependent methyltransferase